MPHKSLNDYSYQSDNGSDIDDPHDSDLDIISKKYFTLFHLWSVWSFWFSVITDVVSLLYDTSGDFTIS